MTQEKGKIRKRKMNKEKRKKEKENGKNTGELM
jgi:hypothetical protein